MGGVMSRTGSSVTSGSVMTGGGGDGAAASTGCIATAKSAFPRRKASR